MIAVVMIGNSLNIEAYEARLAKRGLQFSKLLRNRFGRGYFYVGASLGGISLATGACLRS